MKRNRILAALLALTLFIGLSCPALADRVDTDPPMWEQWGYASLEDYLTEWNETEEEYYQEAARYVAETEEWPAWREAYLAAHPNYAAGLLAKDAEEPMWQDWGFESPEEFEDVMCSEDMSYTDWLVDWNLESVFWDEWYAAQRLREREAMGGPAEGVGVMWMGTYVQFPDAQPVIRNGRTMVPVRAFMEFTGAEVDYGDNTVFLTLPDGTEISFVIGETAAKLTRGGVDGSFTMDTPTYVENDRTYVPLRFFSEALGCDVFWDADYETAVVIDPAETIEEINGAFTIMNRVLSAQERDNEKAYSVRGSMTGDLTLFDTLKGDKNCGLAMEFSGLTQGMNMDVKASWDMREFLSLLLGSVEPLTGEMDEDTAALLAALESTELELIYNGDADQMFLRSPMVPVLAGLLLGADADFPADAWYGFCPGLEELNDAAASAPAAATVGDLLYMLSASDYAGIGAYADVMQTASELAAWIGDDCFTEEDGGWTLRFALDELLERFDVDYDEISALYGDYDVLGVENFDVQLRVDADGNCSGSADVLIDNTTLGMKLAAKLVLTGEQMSCDVFLHLRNSMELHLVTDATVEESAEAPRQTPPAAEQVFDLDAGELPLGDVPAETVTGTAGLGLL